MVEGESFKAGHRRIWWIALGVGVVDRGRLGETVPACVGEKGRMNNQFKGMSFHFFAVATVWNR